MRQTKSKKLSKKTSEIQTLLDANDGDLGLPSLAQNDSLPDLPFDPDLNYEHSRVLLQMHPNRKELPRNREPFVY